MQHTAAATSRNHQLDGLRGYAAMAVVVFHSILGADWTLIQRVLSPPLRDVPGTYERLTKFALAVFGGDTAVVIFFTMSGAVLFASLRREQDHAIAMAVNFAVRRVLRIYPTLALCLILAMLIFPSFGLASSPEQFFVNLALYDFPLNGASWTLNVEMLAAPYIFLCYLSFRRWGEVGLMVACVTGWIIKTSAFTGLMIMFKPTLMCFALGMLIPTRFGKMLAMRLPSWTWVVWLTTMLFAKHLMLLGGLNTAEKIQQISAGLLVAMIYYQRAGSLGHALGTPASGFFGRISYTLYLSSALWLEPICAWVRAQPDFTARPLESGLVASVIIIPLTIPLAYLITVAIEEPAIRLGRKLTRSRAIPAGTV